MVQIDQSSPQQWSEYFTAAHMGFPPPTRWSIQRANEQYRDHLVGQLTNLCAITFWRISAFLDFFYKHSRGTRLYFKPRNLNFQESRYMCGSFCSKGLCFPCCVLMCVVCLCVLCACVVCRKCWKCFLTSCGHARNPPKDSVSPLLYHSATLKRYISISFNQIDTDSAFDYYGYSWQIPIQDFEQNLRSWNSETERYFNKICPFIFPPILKDWRHLVVRLKRMTTICPVIYSTVL